MQLQPAGGKHLQHRRRLYAIRRRDADRHAQHCRQCVQQSANSCADRNWSGCPHHCLSAGRKHFGNREQRWSSDLQSQHCRWNGLLGHRKSRVLRRAPILQLFCYAVHGESSRRKHSEFLSDGDDQHDTGCDQDVSSKLDSGRVVCCAAVRHRLDTTQKAAAACSLRSWFCNDSGHIRSFRLRRFWRRRICTTHYSPRTGRQLHRDGHGYFRIRDNDTELESRCELDTRQALPAFGRHGGEPNDILFRITSKVQSPWIPNSSCQ